MNFSFSLSHGFSHLPSQWGSSRLSLLRVFRLTEAQGQQNTPRVDHGSSPKQPSSTPWAGRSTSPLTPSSGVRLAGKKRNALGTTGAATKDLVVAPFRTGTHEPAIPQQLLYVFTETLWTALLMAGSLDSTVTSWTSSRMSLSLPLPFEYY